MVQPTTASCFFSWEFSTVILTAFLSMVVVGSELLALLRLVLLASSPPSGDNNFVTFGSKVHETFCCVFIVCHRIVSSSSYTIRNCNGPLSKTCECLMKTFYIFTSAVAEL